jgi:hypothetical protein
MTPLEMVKEFQCPGCMVGNDPTDCQSYKLQDDGDCFHCSGHYPGTFVGGVGKIILGLPKGFCRVGNHRTMGHEKQNLQYVRLWKEGKYPSWDKLNIPVWAMEKECFLYVRTYMPRINYPIVDVIQGGKLSLCQQALNVGDFIDEID